MCAIYMLPRKYQIKVSILICLSVMVLVGSGFETKCPEPSQWKFRKKICDTPENYSCLYNIQTGQYEESCSDKIDFVKAGKQYIRTGGRGRDSADCNDLRYQPTKFWSDETSDCEMLKSTCSEEGQVAVSDGSSIEDRACRCDTLNGFGSITTNTSSCIPSVEDCNCYRTTYDKSEIHARGFDYGKFPKTSRKYYPVRETGIKLPESRSSTGTSRTVFTLGKESIWKKLNRNGYTIVDVVLQDMVLCLCFSTVFGVLIFVWRKKFGSFLNSFEGKYRFFEDLIQDNWVHLKENGNSPTWKKKFIEANFMTENDPELQVLLKRKQLVELLLNKCRHSVKTKEDIRMVISTIFQYQISDTRTSSRTEYALSNVTSEGITRWTEILSNNRKMIETKLTREDVITIKDDLVQHYIISLKENENLMQPCGQSSLAAQLIELLINKLRTGSYQCFLQSLETIKNSEDDRNRLTDLINVLTRDSTDDDLFSGASFTPTPMQSSPKCIINSQSSSKSRVIMSAITDVTLQIVSLCRTRRRLNYKGEPHIL